MMVFTNDSVIVEICDIRKIGKLPRYVAEELKAYYEPGEFFEVFRNKESIEFFKKREEIINYNYISKLTDEEIKTQCSDLKKELDRMSKIYLDSPTAVRAKYDKNREYNKKIDNMVYKLMKMEFYLRHRNEIDSEFIIFMEDEPNIGNDDYIKTLTYTNKEQ